MTRKPIELSMTAKKKDFFSIFNKLLLLQEAFKHMNIGLNCELDTVQDSVNVAFYGSAILDFRLYSVCICNFVELSQFLLSVNLGIIFPFPLISYHWTDVTPV